MQKSPNILRYENSMQCWEGINEYLATQHEEIERKGGGRYGPEMVSYNNLITIDRAWVDPDFDFGKVLGYRMQKWSSLVNNYVDMNYFEVIKMQVLHRENKNSTSYNLSYVFDNSHSSGKGCLLSLTFTRRLGTTYPILHFTLRASEVTKRLLWDLLLIQRMGEYVYGEGARFGIEIFCPHMYISAECFVIYDNHRRLKRFIKKKNKNNWTTYQKRIMTIYERFKTKDPEEVTYKVHRRSLLQLQKDENGDPLSGAKSLKAKDLTFGLTKVK